MSSSLFSSDLIIASAVFRSETGEYVNSKVNVDSSQRNDRLLKSGLAPCNHQNLSGGCPKKKKTTTLEIKLFHLSIRLPLPSTSDSQAMLRQMKGIKARQRLNRSII